MEGGMGGIRLRNKELEKGEKHIYTQNKVCKAIGNSIATPIYIGPLKSEIRKYQIKVNEGKYFPNETSRSLYPG